FIDHALVGAKADGIAEEAGYRAELTAIRAATPGLDRNDAKCAPALADALEGALGHLGNQVELGEIYFVPRDDRILLESGFAFLAEVIHRGVDILELAARGIRDDRWPGLSGCPESHGICRA